MKNICCFLSLFCLFSFYVQSQNYEDVVYLKNDSTIHGIIIEQVPNESLKIQTIDGNIHSCLISDVKKMTKERFDIKVKTPEIEAVQRYQVNQRNYYYRKNPATAFWLSFFVPGLGQVYNGQTGKGLAMLTIDVVAACMISKYAYTHNDYNYYHEQPRTTSIVYFSVATSLFVSVWSMIDAVSSAKEINKLNGLSSYNYKFNKNTNLTFKPDFKLDGLGRGEINPVMGAKLSLNMH